MRDDRQPRTAYARDFAQNARLLRVIPASFFVVIPVSFFIVIPAPFFVVIPAQAGIQK
jgi:hypothetical protein